MAKGRKSNRANVEHCEYHTREDDRTGLEIRIGDCNGFCRIMAQVRGGFVLTSFLLKLDTYSDDDLRKADPIKAAKVYKINPAHAEGYILMERQRRGIHV